VHLRLARKSDTILTEFLKYRPKLNQISLFHAPKIMHRIDPTTPRNPPELPEIWPQHLKIHPKFNQLNQMHRKMHRIDPTPRNYRRLKVSLDCFCNCKNPRVTSFLPRYIGRGEGRPLRGQVKNVSVTSHQKLRMGMMGTKWWMYLIAFKNAIDVDTASSLACTRPYLDVLVLPLLE
jgi:hypothetical protein